MQLHNRFKLAFGATALAMLAGCANSATENALEREQAMYERQQERQEQQIKTAQQQIKTMPDWVIQTPAPDDTGIYGMGIGESDTLMLALRKANIEARFNVAKEVNTVLSGEETSIGARDSEYRGIMNTFVDSVNVAGTQDIDRVVEASPNGFRVYTLVKLPYPEFNTAIDQYANQDAQAAARIDEQYDRLMARVANTPTYEPTEVEVAPLPEGAQNLPDELLLRALQDRQEQ